MNSFGVPEGRVPTPVTGLLSISTWKVPSSIPEESGNFSLDIQILILSLTTEFGVSSLKTLVINNQFSRPSSICYGELNQTNGYVTLIVIY